MVAKAFLLLSVISIVTQNAVASDWNTADQAVWISCPDPSRFVQIVNRPFAATWRSNDKQVILGINSAPVTKGVLFVRDDMEKVFAKQISGQIIDSSSFTLNGHTICKMTGIGVFNGCRGVASIYTFTVGDNLYKLTGFSTSPDPTANVDVRDFLNSLQIPSRDGRQYDIVNSTRANLAISSNGIASAIRAGDNAAQYLIYLTGALCVYFAWRRLSRLA